MPMSSDDLTRRHQRFPISRRAAKIRQGLPFGEETSAVGLGLSNKIAVRSSELNGNPSQPISKRKQIGTEGERMHLSRRRHRMHESKDRQRSGRDNRAPFRVPTPLTSLSPLPSHQPFALSSPAFLQLKIIQKYLISHYGIVVVCISIHSDPSTMEGREERGKSRATMKGG